MSTEAKVPEDLREQYERVKRSSPQMGWRFALPLYERIATLEARCERMRSALEVIRKRAQREYPVSIGNQNAWALVEQWAENALAEPAARAFTDERLEAIRQVEEEIALLAGWRFVCENNPAAKRILARTEAHLAELKRGLK